MNNAEFLKYFDEHDTCGGSMGIHLVKLEDGYAEATMSLSEKTRNIRGTLHGGAMATMADIVAGTSLYYHHRVMITLNCTLNYLRGPETDTVRAISREIRAGGRTCVCQVDISDELGNLCCTALFTFYLKGPSPFAEM